MRLRGRTFGLLGALVAVWVVFVFLVPVISYAIPVTIPADYEAGTEVCSGISNGFVRQACLDRFLYPPVDITARAPLSYGLFGIGTPSFYSEYLVTRAGFSALVYPPRTNSTANASAIRFPYPISSLNPQSPVDINNVSVVRSPDGFVNVSATLGTTTSVGLSLISADLYFAGDTSNSNYTFRGITWISGSQMVCRTIFLQPGCRAYHAFAGGDSQIGKLVSFRIVLTGVQGGNYFVIDRQFHAIFPPRGVDANWVSAFIQDVNAARNGSRLQGSQLLDEFASKRATTAILDYQVSNAGFQNDYFGFFNGSMPTVSEVILYPGSAPPVDYISFLKMYAPGHWTPLNDSRYGHFGYSIQKGPVVVALLPCPVTEFPGNINVTTFLTSNGCKFEIQQEVWLVIELSA
ncbi:MAG: hypothetical protein OK422_02010 [Thaumarchaeota archaeon]|nr:hypothetical protein [Nitrososphaerota archaeon]